LREGEPSGPEPSLERPPKAELGDYSSNAAMLLAAPLGENPRDVAARLADRLRSELGEETVERIVVAGPGFLNFFLADNWYRRAMSSLADVGETLGPRPTGSPERILVEFVSANPTGPLHVGHGRQAAFGATLSNLLQVTGHEVAREYYINDAGRQMDILAVSVWVRYLEAGGELLPFPENGYRAAYVAPLAQALRDRVGARLQHPAAAVLAGLPADAPAGDKEAYIDALIGRCRDLIGAAGFREVLDLSLELMLADIRGDLAEFGVVFEQWTSEREFAESGAIDHALEVLRRQGRLLEKDGATWFRATEFGDEKDRVVVRENGVKTYFASDIAYHLEKRERGFARLIDVLGADHHGYVARVRAAFAALGGDPDKLELIIMQFVNVIERGERASMSKRRGDFVTLDDLLDEIGVDAARFFLLQRSHDTTVDLDLDLARQESSDNPVYYVQYAHARIASLRQKAGEARVEAALAAVGGGLGPDQALEPAERTLVNKLVAFPGEVEEAAERRAPHRLAAYALELAQEFTAFYRDCRVVGAEPEAVESFRLALSVAAQRTIARALDLLGVTAPDEM
jgi:arginyl-tRNA synthetase